MAVKKVEYLKLDLNSASRKEDDEDLLNGAGEEGWVLVQVMPNNHAYMMRVEEPEAPAPKRRGRPPSTPAAGE